MNKLRSLHIGVNYRGTSAELRGCENDAQDFAAVFAKRGYDTRLLLEQDATKAGILSALAERVAETGYRDRLVVTYSGHGTNIPDRNGDEPDGRDEALVPFDFRDAGLITDDELNAVFEQRRFGSQIVFFPDSCFSGTVSKWVGVTTTQVPVLDRPRYLPPWEIDPSFEQRATPAEGLPLRRTRANVVLLSGCADGEYSYDAFINGRYNGAMTRSALEVLRDGDTFASWHDKIRTDSTWKLPSKRYPQTPQLDATRRQRRWRVL